MNKKDIFKINIFGETFMRNFSIKEGQAAMGKEQYKEKNNFLKVTTTKTKQQWAGLNNKTDTAEDPDNNLEEWWLSRLSV